MRRTLVGLFLALLGGTTLAGSTPHNTYPRSQCTFYAAERRPDLLVFLADAKDWDDRARAAGFPVVAEPAQGSIAVFEPGEQGALDNGHVAYVERVIDPTSFEISELNWGITVAQRSIVHRRTAHAGPGVSFIQTQGSAANGTATADLSPSPSAQQVDSGYDHLVGVWRGEFTRIYTVRDGVYTYKGEYDRIAIERQVGGSVLTLTAHIADADYEDSAVQDHMRGDFLCFDSYAGDGTLWREYCLFPSSPNVLQYRGTAIDADDTGILYRVEP